jgi:branched-chain amino acid transport system permease protein
VSTLKAFDSARWVKIALLCVVLVALPFVIDATLGRAWVRIIDVALLFVMLALGLSLIHI